MTTNAQQSTKPASAKAVQTGTADKTLPMTPQVKKNIAAVWSAYNAYRQSGGKESIRAWVRPQVEAALKAHGTTSGQTEKPMDEGIGAGTVILALADVALGLGGPLGVVAGLLIDSIVEGAGDGGDGGDGGSGDGSHGDNPGGGGSPA
jgi:hypothetical protein